MRERKAPVGGSGSGSATRFSTFCSLAALSRCSSLRPTYQLNLFFFSPFLSKQGLGYTDEDSAGQSNIFAVEVRKKRIGL